MLGTQGIEEQSSAMRSSAWERHSSVDSTSPLCSGPSWRQEEESAERRFPGSPGRPPLGDMEKLA